MVTALVTDELPFVDFKPAPGTAGMYIELYKQREILLNRKSNVCKDYKGGRKEYNDCIKDFMWSHMDGKMTCKYPGTLNINISFLFNCSEKKYLFKELNCFYPIM